MQSLFLATSISAVTEFLKRLRAKDWEGAGVIAVAAVIGLLGGLLHVEGLTWDSGLLFALGIVGIHNIARQVG